MESSLSQRLGGGRGGKEKQEENDVDDKSESKHKHNYPDSPDSPDSCANKAEETTIDVSNVAEETWAKGMKSNFSHSDGIILKTRHRNSLLLLFKGKQNQTSMYRILLPARP